MPLPPVSKCKSRCSEVDKFLLTFVILKLRLIKGKCIIFVNDVDRSYRLKLFLEQFSIKSCVLNSELPLNSRSVSFRFCDYRSIFNMVESTGTTPSKNSTRASMITSLQQMNPVSKTNTTPMMKRRRRKLMMKNVRISSQPL